MKQVMKYGFVTLLAIAMMGVTTGCTRIEPGWVGIKVNQAGSNKGVEDYPMQTGWVFYNPVTTRVYEYPTFQQNVIWCASPNEGKSVDESISFNCKGGAGITADVSMSGKFVTPKVPYIFTKFRADPEVIVHTYLRNEVRDAWDELKQNMTLWIFLVIRGVNSLMPSKQKCLAVLVIGGRLIISHLPIN